VMYRLLRKVGRFVFQVAYGFEVTGLEQVPAEGGCILAANHTSKLDPPLLYFIFPRLVHFMAKKELFRWFPLGWIITKLGAFPVDRGAADRGAIRRAQEILSGGGVVGVFPEGTTRGVGLRPFHNGAALLALKTGSPVVPVAINWCSKRPFRGSSVRIAVGKPIRVPGKKERVAKHELVELTREIRDSIAQMLEEGGREGFTVVTTNYKCGG
jgi:1-acyl-sn-glycerol-3-phosphate acyltransferase